MRGWIAQLVKLIAFLVITAFFTYVLAATIANQAFGEVNAYKANFTDVTGLTQGDDVRIAGVRVGSVEGIKILRQKNGRSVAQVDFTVAKSRPLPQSVQAKLRYRNLVGQRYIDIMEGPGKSTGTLKPGGTISIDNTQPAVDLTVLFAGFKPLVAGLDADQLNQLSLEIIKTLQGEAGSFELLLRNLADLTNSIADKDQVIGDVIDNLSGVLVAVGNRDQELSQLIIQLKNFVSGLAQDRKTIGNAIDGINNLATSTASLLTQARAPLKKDIPELTGLIGSLNRNSSTLTFVLQQLPPTVAGLIRTGQYGSWFNFYLCNLDGTLKLPGGRTVDLSGLKNSSAPRCN